MSLQESTVYSDALPASNHLLDCLPPEQRKTILAQCELIDLSVGTILCEAGEPFDYAYFPLTGTISLVNRLVGHPPFETESVGWRGMLGATLVLDTRLAPQRGIAQTPCQALRMATQSLEIALRRYPELFRIVQCYLFVVLAELLQTAGCARFHDAGKRLARSLLMANDYARSDHLHLTHQLLADMLGVQRGAVTIAAIKLQQEGVIHYSRGKVAILDRKGLESKSCECYAASLRNYQNMLS